MKQIVILFLCSAVALFFSCQKDKPVEKPDFGYDYYPNQKGHYIIYDCDSVVHHDLTYDSTVYKFQIKEKIDCVFIDNQGRQALRISRYKKLQKIDSTWQPFPQVFEIQDVWWANKTSSTAEVVEENNRYIKLVFPVEKDKTWDGNAQNTIGRWDYTYTEIDVPLTVSNIPFEKTLHVKQYDSGNNILVRKKYDETYGRGAGLIVKEITDYTWKQDGGGVHIGQIAYGFYFKMTAVTIGVE